jgi:hypothetical protein
VSVRGEQRLEKSRVDVENRSNTQDSLGGGFENGLSRLLEARR